MAMAMAPGTHSAATAVLSKHEGHRFGFGLRGSEGGGPVSICISRKFWRREFAFSKQCGNSRLRITRCEAAGENFGVRVGRMAEGFRQKAGKAAHVVATKADEATYVVSRKANETVRAISRNAGAFLSEVKWKVYEFQERNDVEGKVHVVQARVSDMRDGVREKITQTGEQIQHNVEICKSTVSEIGGKIETNITKRLGTESSLAEYVERKGKELKTEMVGTAENVYSGVVSVSNQPIVKLSLFGFLFCYVLSIAWAARVLILDKKSEEARNQFGRELRLQKLLEGEGASPFNKRAIMVGPSSEKMINGSSSAIIKDRDDEAFLEKVRKIREMARAVRTAEQEVFSPAESGFVSIAGMAPTKDSEKLASLVNSARRKAQQQKKNIKARKQMQAEVENGVFQASDDALNSMHPKSETTEPGPDDSERVNLSRKLSSNGKAPITFQERVASLKETLAGVAGSEELDSTSEAAQSENNISTNGSVGFETDTLIGPGDDKHKAMDMEIPPVQIDSFKGTGMEKPQTATSNNNSNNNPGTKDAQFLEGRSNTVLSPVNGSSKSLNGAATEPTNFNTEITPPNNNSHAVPHVNGVARSATTPATTTGSQPQKFKSMRVITSPEEARARIAAKKAKEGNSSLSSKSSNNDFVIKPKYEKVKNARVEPEVGNPGAHSEEEQASKEQHASKEDTISSGDVPNSSSHLGPKFLGLQQEDVGEPPQNEIMEEATVEDLEEVDTGEVPVEEQEEEAWMRDEVLRAIVFKVRDNEEAGRESFHGLDSKAEQLFFKGLERKYEREGEAVKDWIQERVENLDYGMDRVGVDDVEEDFLPRWKDPENPYAKKYKKFGEDRMRIIQQQMGISSPDPPPEPKGNQKSTTAATSSPSSSPTRKAKDSSSKGGLKERHRSNENASVSGSRTVVTTSGRKPKPESQEWKHTKKWVQELQKKYDMETDPEQRAIMEEVGQDLEKWITEEEITQAGNLLSKGLAGEEEYARIHYEKTRDKIRRQHEMFGEQGMLNKYAEYKTTRKESELWWLDLPFVLCIGLVTNVNGVDDHGLYSLDMTPNMEGLVEGKQETKYHTVAFQDQKEAVNFCSLLLSERHFAEVVPLAPKDLRQDALREGFHVTVLKKGELGLRPGQALEEVEERMIEIGSAIYWEELEHARSIDIDAVLDDGLGYGRSPSSS